MSSYGDTWADIYDQVHTITEDIPFWVEEAMASGGPVLELACGTGRIAIPVAQAGVAVVGLDSSAAMLKLARAKARRLSLGADVLRFARGDMRSFSLAQRFPLVIIPFRSFQLLLSVAEQHQALEAIRAHLSPGGRLIFSLFVPGLDLLTRDPSTPMADYEVAAPMYGHRLLVSLHSQYDTFNQVAAVHTSVQEVDERGAMVGETHRDHQLRYLYRFEAQHLLAACGYDVVDVYGSFDREPLSESSTEMVWVATPAG
ncbi:MAG: class I SAM-dependent methyltransferase [Dehalococcoidia bacterium]|nr:class I SAM-dependent methyltransferase [Dehalococcoidia bacterium]